jgi:flagellar basal body-associated protein FliL
VKKKLLIVLPVVLLVAAGAAYKLVLAPKPVQAKPKVAGALWPITDPFLLNLAGGRYAKVSVALVLDGVTPPAAGATLPVPQEPAVRAVITDRLTGVSASELIDRDARHQLLAELRKDLLHATDDKVDQVLLTDVTVQ